jgi:hypothetical protein
MGADVPKFTPHFMAIPYGDEENIQGHSKIVNLGGYRPHVLALIRGTQVPFYISTGLGGKDSVEPGKWYPHFGQGKDGWLNKASESAINEHYGSRHLKSVADWLNTNVGDVRDDHRIPEVNKTGPHVDAMNKDLSPVTWMESYGNGHHPNITNTLKKIHIEPRHLSQEERLQDSNAHYLLKQHAKAHPELNLGTSLP